MRVHAGVCAHAGVRVHLCACALCVRVCSHMLAELEEASVILFAGCDPKVSCSPAHQEKKQL